MIETQTTSNRLPAFVANHGLTALVVFATLSTAAYAFVAAISSGFRYEAPLTDRPIPTVLISFAVAFLVYLAALWIAVHIRPSNRLLGCIVSAAVVFRLVLLFSVPIQEVDIYRYLWDGASTTAGVSPYRYSPDQVRLAVSVEEMPSDLQALVAVRDSSPEVATILSRVHFGELSTIYPPTSQCVFALVDRMTPPGATVDQRLTLMKGALILFDLGTLALVVGLLRRTGRHVGWSLAYGWCPLLMKEVANSGHLDAVAVFLTTLAIYIAVRVHAERKELDGSAPREKVSAGKRVTASLVLSAGVLALAVGAKLYPLILAPWLFAVGVRRVGWRRMLLPASVFGSLVALVLLPMVWRSTDTVGREAAHGQSTLPPEDLPPELPELAAARSQLPRGGLATFLRRWEMNDFLFMLVVENLKPGATDQQKSPAEPWFAVVPVRMRMEIVAPLSAAAGIAPREAAFHLARLVTGGVFCVLALTWARRAALTGDAAKWLELAFLTLAWFWLLAPTQNPWYWTWALPLLPFARSRAWLVVSGVVLIYYLRFWLDYQWPHAAVPGTPYPGSDLFDLVVTWLEFAPWFVWLAWDGYR